MSSVQIKKTVLWREIDNEVILLETEKGNFFRLNKTAALFLKRVTEGSDVATATAQVADEFKAPTETVGKDIEVFLASMKEHGILETNG